VRKGCCPNVPGGAHSTQAGAPLDVAPVALPEPPAPARAAVLDEVAPPGLDEKEDPAVPDPELGPLADPATVGTDD
jgi:hypothetical protein